MKKCPVCNAEVSDESKFCNVCGYQFVGDADDAHAAMRNYDRKSSLGNDKQSLQKGDQITEGIDRNDPEFKKAVKMCIILSAIGFGFGLLALVGGLLIKFSSFPEALRYAFGIPLLAAGTIGGLIFVALTSAKGKKVFSQNKLKGFLENLPGIFLALTIMSIFGGFLLIGIIFFIS